MRQKFKQVAFGIVCMSALLTGTLSASAATTVSSTTNRTVSSGTTSVHQKLAPTKLITYTSEGFKQTVKANLFVSTQGYHMYVLPGFQASGEEPGKDVVLYRRNQNNFMRIEKLPQSTNLKDVHMNLLVGLKSVGKVQAIRPKSYGDPFFRSAAYIDHVHTHSVDQTAYVIQIKGDLYRILLSTQAGTESITPYWAMMRTIEGAHSSASTSTTGIAAGTIQTAIVQQQIGTDGSFNFILQVKNQTDEPQELTFNTGQQYDYLLYKDGVLAMQYSRGKMFSMHVEIVTLKQGEQLQFPIQLSGLAPGNYHLVSWVTYASSTVNKATADFTIQ